MGFGEFDGFYAKHLDEEKHAWDNCDDLRSCVMIELLVADDEDPIMGASALSEMV